ncbi:MAG TPA: hypothetical protein PLJ21_01030 [Pseudobdellovibrionaceae bacterium]|nr:hypothetical protein [Pseudobdellovibrionaceae bacterium]
MINNFPEFKKIQERDVEKNLEVHKSKEDEEKLKLELFNKYKIDSNDPIIGVIDYLDQRLKKTESAFNLFQSKYDDSFLKMMILTLENQSKHIEKIKVSIGVIPTLFILMGVFGLGFFVHDLYKKIESKIFQLPRVSTENFEKRSTYFISNGTVEKVFEENGVYRIEVSHVVKKGNGKN